MPPLVSVVVPAYGHAELILDCLESVFRQTYPAYEIIVVNDGSPDDTEERLRTLIESGRIRYVRQANAGQAAARNHGASLARGEYLAFLDDDDLWPPESLALRVAALEADPTLEVAFGDVLQFSAAPPTVPPYPRPPQSTPVGWLGLFVGNPIVSPGQTLVRRSAFNAVGGFDPSVWGADDWDLWFRLFQRRDARRLDHATLLYRVHQANASRDAVRLGENVLRTLQRYLPLVPPGYRPAVRFYSYLHVGNNWRRLVRRQLRTAWADGAWEHVLRACRVDAQFALLILTARVSAKAHLVARGRWRFGGDSPIMRALFEGSGSLDAPARTKVEQARVDLGSLPS